MTRIDTRTYQAHFFATGGYDYILITCDGRPVTGYTVDGYQPLADFLADDTDFGNWSGDDNWEVDEAFAWSGDDADYDLEKHVQSHIPGIWIATREESGPLHVFESQALADRLELWTRFQR